MPDQRSYQPPGFLLLSPACPKLRSAQLTHVLDKGVAAGDLRGLLARFAFHVDIWKLGWGTAYLDTDLPEKLEVLDRHDVRACVAVKAELLQVAATADTGAAGAMVDEVRRGRSRLASGDDRWP